MIVALESRNSVTSSARAVPASTAATTRCLEGLREAAESVPRPSELPPLEISVSPRGRIDRDLARAFAALGVHRLVVIPPRAADVAGLEQFITGIGSDLVGQV